MNFTREEIEALIAAVDKRIYDKERWLDRVVLRPEPADVQIVELEHQIEMLIRLGLKLTELLAQFEKAA